MLGHSGISTAEIYTKISVDKVKAATNKVVNNILAINNANTELDKIIPENTTYKQNWLSKADSISMKIYIGLA
ncbi:integrase [Orientia tsutsugamushi]|nr:hypothetical protein OTSTA763_1625 [Orientia tsutsugamushi str. TA763]SPP25047.1 integrase [Orientia tsutsugamushi]